jgi:hypothetical protein
VLLLKHEVSLIEGGSSYSGKLRITQGAFTCHENCDVIAAEYQHWQRGAFASCVMFKVQAVNTGKSFG